MEFLREFPFQAVRAGFQPFHMAAGDGVFAMEGALQQDLMVLYPYAADPIGKNKILIPIQNILRHVCALLRW